MSSQTIYWHRDLPPLDAELVGERTVEATSGRVPGTLTHRSELWDGCYEDLMAQTRIRLEQEIARHDDAKGEAWLHGRFTYTLFTA
jgi:hypothetical protein